MDRFRLDGFEAVEQSLRHYLLRDVEGPTTLYLSDRTNGRNDEYAGRIAVTEKDLAAWVLDARAVGDGGLLGSLGTAEPHGVTLEEGGEPPDESDDAARQQRGARGRSKKIPQDKADLIDTLIVWVKWNALRNALGAAVRYRVALRVTKTGRYVFTQYFRCVDGDVVPAVSDPAERSAAAAVDRLAEPNWPSGNGAGAPNLTQAIQTMVALGTSVCRMSVSAAAASVDVQAGAMKMLRAQIDRLTETNETLAARIVERDIATEQATIDGASADGASAVRRELGQGALGLGTTLLRLFMADRMGLDARQVAILEVLGQDERALKVLARPEVAEMMKDPSAREAAFDFLEEIASKYQPPPKPSGTTVNNAKEPKATTT